MSSHEILREIDLEAVSLDIGTVKKIPEEMARDKSLIAFREDDNKLFVAIDQAPSLLLMEELKFISGKNISFFKAGRKKIFELINTYYCRDNLNYAIKNIKSNEITSSLNSDFTPDKDTFQSSPVIKATNYVIDKAIDERASDLHIEPFESKVTIRFRVDGIIREFINIPKDIYPFICTRIKIMGDMNIAEKRMPQDGKIKYTKENCSYDLRVSTLPTIHGEKIVLRILYKDKRIRSLKMLGFSSEDSLEITNMLKYQQGIIIITGPTGSGKSTTLYSMLNNLNKKEKNIISIEDPVEYTLEQVNQVNVNNKTGFTFAKGLRSILRQDPDVIMLGEIRDEETAHIAVRAAITGHLVMSTLHTKDAVEAILRLEDMGVPEYFIEDALLSVISQRLVRKICPNCKVEYIPSSIEVNLINLLSEDKLYKGKGCSKCNNTGYRGRTVIYEIVNLSKIKKDYTKNGSFIDKIKDYRSKENLISTRRKCIELIKRGITTYDEFLRISG